MQNTETRKNRLKNAMRYAIIERSVGKGLGAMQGYNCIMIYDKTGEKLLFCRRQKEPYKGKYNFVGGKIEQGESGFAAAYRELEEETGITSAQVILRHMMDFTYYNQDCYVEVYVGRLKEEVVLRKEKHPLEFLNVKEDDFFSLDKFAGEGNIGHMVQQVMDYGEGMKEEQAWEKNKMSK